MDFSILFGVFDNILKCPDSGDEHGYFHYIVLQLVCIKIVLPRKPSDGKGISVKGQFIDGKIDVLENYYGLAKRENKL
jgi:hypothetical protein